MGVSIASGQQPPALDKGGYQRDTSRDYRQFAGQAQPMQQQQFQPQHQPPQRVGQSYGGIIPSNNADLVAALQGAMKKRSSSNMQVQPPAYG